MQAEVNNWVHTLHKYKQRKDPKEAKRLHQLLISQHMDTHGVIGNHLVNMLVDCGCLQDAHLAFERLHAPFRTERTWTSLISGFTANGRPDNAVLLFYQMQKQNFAIPTMYTVVAVLNACSKLEDCECGYNLHIWATAMGLETELFVGSALVDMYGKLGLLAEACCVFDSLPMRSPISWTALIAGYSLHGLHEGVIKYFVKREREGMALDSGTFVLCLKSCAATRALRTAQGIHTEIIKFGFESELFVGNTLVDLYCKCDSLEEAQRTFNMIDHPDTVSWTALMSGYAEHGIGEEVLGCFQRMQEKQGPFDTVIFLCTLKACSMVEALEIGQAMHAEVIKRGFEANLQVGNTIVDMYNKCGLLGEACQLLDQLPVEQAVSFQVQYGYEEGVMIPIPGIDPTPSQSFTFLSALQACSTIRDLHSIHELHSELIKRGLEKNPCICNTLVDTYTKCESFFEALKVFGLLSVKTAVSWSALIVGYAQYCLHEEIISCFKEIQLTSILLDSVTFVCMLKACSMIGALDCGHKIYSEAIKMGFDQDLYVGSTLVDMYGKHGLLVEAKCVFSKLLVQDAVAWNALIAGYVEHGCMEEVLISLKSMHLKGLCVDAVTCISGLKACVAMQSVELRQELHIELAKKGMERELHVGNMLVDMYGRWGLIWDAYQVFSKMPVQDVVSWNALISGYLENGFGEEVLNCFRRMQEECGSVDVTTFALCLKTCGDMGALETGREIHAEVKRSHIERDLFLGSVLIGMYGKCGSIVEGQKVFHDLPCPNVVSWNAMMKSYSENQASLMAIQCFEEMEGQGLKPNATTFTCVLSACSRVSLVLEGQAYFKAMIEHHKIQPTLRHHACMVDLFARSGQVHMAERFVAAMQCTPPHEVLTSLLSACRIYGKLEVGQICFEQLMELNTDDASAFLMMQDIYANAGMWDDADKVEEMRNHAGAKKKPGGAFIEVNKMVYGFVVGSRPSEYLVHTLASFTLHFKKEGFVPNIDVVPKRLYQENIEATSEFWEKDVGCVG